MKPIFLDATGKPSATVVIRKDRPAPEGNFAADSGFGALRSAIRLLKPGESFDTTAISQHVHQAAKQVKIKIATRKLNGSGYSVWRRA